MTIKEALKWGRDVLSENEVEGPEASANFLLRQILGKDKVFLITHDSEKLGRLQELKYRRWIKKRSKHEPVWYITGNIEFGELILSVNQHVLIPRPETELMLEMIAKQYSGEKRKLKVLDVGTGSGTIILSLVKALGAKNHEYFASEVSKDTLAVAKKNAQQNDLEGDVDFREGDLFAPWVGEKFDLIVANLPYVPHEDMATLAFDLTHYEPRVALDGGVLGLEVYKRFIEQLPAFLNAGGKAYLEIGYDQGRHIEDFVHKYLPKAKVRTEGDYQQIDRIVIIETE